MKRNLVIRLVLSVIGTVVILGSLAPAMLAQTTDRPEVVVAQRRAAALAARLSRATSPRQTVQGVNVVGVAWTSEHRPITNPRLRLRNVVSGLVSARAVGNTNGEFTFEQVDSGTYVVELVDNGDRVRAVGEMVTVAAGETVATFVVLSRALPAVPAILGNTAAAAAAGAGVSGLATVGSPASREG